MRAKTLAHAPTPTPPPSAFRPIGHHAQRGQQSNTNGVQLARPTPGRVRRRRLLGAFFGRNRPTSPETRKQLSNVPVRRARTEPRSDAAPRRMLSTSHVDRWAGTGTWGGSVHSNSNSHSHSHAHVQCNTPSLDRFTTSRFTSTPQPPSPPVTFLPTISDRFTSRLSHSGSDRCSYSQSSPYTSSDRERRISGDRGRIACVDRFSSPFLSSSSTNADRFSNSVLSNDRFTGNGPVRCTSHGSYSTIPPKGDSPPQRSATYSTFESSPSLRQPWSNRGQRSAFDSLPSLPRQSEVSAIHPSSRVTQPNATRVPSYRMTLGSGCNERCCTRRNRIFRRSRGPCSQVQAQTRVLQADECYRAGFYAGVLASVEAKDCDIASRHLSWDAAQRQNSHSITNDKLTRMLSRPKRRATEHFRSRRWTGTGRFFGTPYGDESFSISMMTRASDNSNRY